MEKVSEEEYNMPVRVTQEELVVTITHLAFYAGWPSAMTAITVAKEVFEK
jgi:4-carboxymuconolactone decarboxylase